MTKKITKYIAYVSDLTLLIQAKVTIKTLKLLSDNTLKLQGLSNNYTHLGYMSFWGIMGGGCLKVLAKTMENKSCMTIANTLLYGSLGIAATLYLLKHQFSKASQTNNLNQIDVSIQEKERNLKIRKELIFLTNIVAESKSDVATVQKKKALL